MKIKSLLITQIILLVLSLPLLTSCVKKPLQLSNNNVNQTAERTAQVIPYYYQISDTYWPKSNIDNKIVADSRNAEIPMIRNKLIVLGDLSEMHDSNSTLYDDYLQQAINRFQWRHGLTINNTIDKKTLIELNVPPIERMKQLVASINKWNNYPDDNNSHYLLVNIPDFSLTINEAGVEKFSTKVVTGKTRHKTPELDSEIKEIVINPTWNIPLDIARFEIAPRLVKDPDYLDNENIEVYDSWNKDQILLNNKAIDWEQYRKKGGKIRMTQTPGDHNSLGRVKFIFESDYGVYLHDTPYKKLFKKTSRAYSHGCIRVENPFDLANYILENSRQYNQEAIEEAFNSLETTPIQLHKPLPIHVTYITAWVDKNGNAQFRKNIYNK